MINPNAPAFPRAFEFSKVYNNDCENEPGMDIRTQIAAMAMQGILSNSSFILSLERRVSNHDEGAQLAAQTAIGFADALIRELNKEG